VRVRVRLRVRVYAGRVCVRMCEADLGNTPHQGTRCSSVRCYRNSLSCTRSRFCRCCQQAKQRWRGNLPCCSTHTHAHTHTIYKHTNTRTRARVRAHTRRHRDIHRHGHGHGLKHKLSLTHTHTYTHKHTRHCQMRASDSLQVALQISQHTPQKRPLFVCKRALYFRKKGARWTPMDSQSPVHDNGFVILRSYSGAGPR